MVKASMKKATTKTATKTTTAAVPKPSIPDTGMIEATLTCGHTKKMDMSLPTNKKGNTYCAKCAGRKPIASWTAVEAAAEEEEAPVKPTKTTAAPKSVKQIKKTQPAKAKTAKEVTVEEPEQEEEETTEVEAVAPEPDKSLPNKHDVKAVVHVHSEPGVEIDSESGKAKIVYTPTTEAATEATVPEEVTEQQQAAAPPSISTTKQTKRGKPVKEKLPSMADVVKSYQKPYMQKPEAVIKTHEELKAEKNLPADARSKEELIEANAELVRLNEALTAELAVKEAKLKSTVASQSELNVSLASYQHLKEQSDESIRLMTLRHNAHIEKINKENADKDAARVAEIEVLKDRLRFLRLDVGQIYRLRGLMAQKPGELVLERDENGKLRDMFDPKQRAAPQVVSNTTATVQQQSPPSLAARMANQVDAEQEFAEGEELEGEEIEEVSEEERDTGTPSEEPQ